MKWASKPYTILTPQVTESGELKTPLCGNQHIQTSFYDHMS